MITTTKQVEGHEIEIKVGSVIQPDGRISECLLPGDKYVDSGYEGSQFRLPTPGLEPLIKSMPVNIEVTGSTLQRRAGSYWTRVRITWVNDCEPNTTSGGWLLVFASLNLDVVHGLDRCLDH